MGFVSNSSTSSFCIYGAAIDCDVLEAMFLNKDQEENYDEDDYGDELYEILEKKTQELGLEYHHPDSDWPCYIGKSWSDVDDNETGRQFKDRVEALVEKMCGKKVECETHQEAYHD